MNTIRKLLLLAVLVPLAFPALEAGAHNAPNRCGSKPGSGAGWFKVRGHNVGCKMARRVAREWEESCKERSCRAGRARRIDVGPGFRCRYRKVGYETVRVRCVASEDRIVHFLWGS